MRATRRRSPIARTCGVFVFHSSEDHAMTAYKMRLRRKKAKQNQKRIKEKAKARRKSTKKRS